MEVQKKEQGSIYGILCVRLVDGMIDMDCGFEYDADFQYILKPMPKLQKTDQERVNEFILNLRHLITLVFSEVYPEAIRADRIQDLENPDISRQMIEAVSQDMGWLGIELTAFSFRSFEMDSGMKARLDKLRNMQASLDPAVQVQKMIGATKVHMDEAVKAAVPVMSAAPVKETEPVITAVSDVEWICSCGTRNDRKFCTECGIKKPEEFQCRYCRTKAAKDKKLPKFCTECGKRFEGIGVN